MTPRFTPGTPGPVGPRANSHQESPALPFRIEDRARVDEWPSIHYRILFFRESKPTRGTDRTRWHITDIQGCDHRRPPARYAPAGGHSRRLPPAESSVSDEPASSQDKRTNSIITDSGYSLGLLTPAKQCRRLILSARFAYARHTRGRRETANIPHYSAHQPRLALAHCSINDHASLYSPPSPRRQPSPPR